MTILLATTLYTVKCIIQSAGLSNDTGNRTQSTWEVFQQSSVLLWSILCMSDSIVLASLLEELLLSFLRNVKEAVDKLNTSVPHISRKN